MKNLSWQKRVITIGLASCLMSGTAFAQATTANNELTQGVVNIFYHILLFLARSRSLLAVIAGKLMTNDMITGGFLHLDLRLRKLWNIMKNFANFGLGFVFLYFVLKSLFDPSDDAKASVVNKLKGFILAGVLIQISRFSVVALVDISTVLTSSVGNLPSIFLSDSPEFEKQLMDANANVIKKKRLILDLNDGLDSLHLSQEESDQTVSKNDLIDSIMPNGTTLSGPLLFLGLSIFSFQDVTLYDYNTINNGGSALITILLNAGITIMYAISLLLLVVVNVVRIGFIRILIAAAPVFALLRGLKWGGVIEKDPLGSDVFSAKTLIELIFIPVRVVLFLSLIMIFVTSMRRLMTDPDTTAINQQLQNYNTSIVNSKTGSTLIIDNIAVQSIEGDIFKDVKSSTQNTLADLVVFVFTLVLMRILVKTSYPSDNAITGKITQGFFEKTEQILGSLPIIPLPGGGKIAASYINKAFEKVKGDAIYSAFGTRDIGDLDRHGKDKWSERVGKQLGQEQRNYLSADERKEIDMAANGVGGSEYADMIQKYASATRDGFTLQNTDRKNSLHTRLKRKLKSRPPTITLGSQKFETKGLEFSNNVDEDLKKFFDMTNATRTNSYFFDQLLTKDLGLGKYRDNPVNSYSELSSQYYKSGNAGTQSSDTQPGTNTAVNTNTTADNQDDDQ